MDIITKTVLNKIQSLEGYETSVIAGGAVRDHIWGIPERDTDICIPKFEGRSEGLLVDALDKEFKVRTKVKGYDPLRRTVGKYDLSQLVEDSLYKDGSSGRLDSVLNFQFEGKDFDIIFSTYEKTEDDFTWADTLVNDFNFGMNMVYYDGFETKTTRAFDRDKINHEMTLINLDSITKLPGAIEKFFNISERYLEKKIVLSFNQTCLKMVKDEPKIEPPWSVKRKGLDYAKLYNENPAAEVELRPIPAFRPLVGGVPPAPLPFDWNRPAVQIDAGGGAPVDQMFEDFDRENDNNNN